MANPHPLPANQFKPGQSGNPGGKPVNARNSLNASFLKALSKEFNEYGEDAIRQVREKDPSTFIKVLAALQPKEMEITRYMDGITDEQLDAAIVAARAIIACENTGTRKEAETVAEPA